MLSLRSHINRFLPALLLVLGLSSCATYNQQIGGYYDHYMQGDYAKASSALDGNKLLSKRRNHLLFLLEKGRMEHLLGRFGSSNRFFNDADNLMEDGRTSLSDVALSTLLNPMMETYRGEDFEKYMVHYYKALNYLMLDQPAEALVEARRISIRTYAQEDVKGKNKYTQDAFSFMLQGLIYEKNKDLNNAFIAYRNAADLYLEHGGSYYGVSMPLQLKKDLLRSAHLLGFTGEQGEYEKKLGYTLTPADLQTDGELVLFWENGRAPVKEEENIVFFLSKDAGQFFFTDSRNSLRVPFDLSIGGVDEGRLSSLTSVRAALPRYAVQPLRYRAGQVQVDSTWYDLEPAQSISDLAQLTLRERRLKDLSKTLSRIAVSKLAEAAVEPTKKKEGKEETKEEKKKRQREELFSAGLKIFNFAKEKADTRNWQSLPHSICYTRVPLKKGAQTLQVQLEGSGSKSYTLNVDNNGGLLFRSLCTL